jgi:hypothetical protein
MTKSRAIYSPQTSPSLKELVLNRPISGPLLTE